MKTLPFFLTLAASQLLASSYSGAARGEGSWRAVASSLEVHESCGAALLPDGRVLVTGGHADQKGGKWRLVNASELFDPTTETWQPTGPLVETRQGIWAIVPLRNGKVLLAGEHDTRTGCELYDPATGKWTRTGSLSSGRGGHSTTLLPDGRVLAAGGVDYSTETVLSSAELYDPATEAWSKTSSMASPRFNHRTVLLKDGKVLAIGGVATEPSQGPLLEAEIYDPASGAWRKTAPMKSAGNAAILLKDGRVLVAGGANGPYGNFTTIAAAQVYDPASDQWTETGSMEKERTQFTTTLLPDGRVLAVGGVSRPGNTALATAEIYDPATGKWTSAGRMKSARWNHRSILLPNGNVLVIGGCTMFGQLSSAEIFTPASN